MHGGGAEEKIEQSGSIAAILTASRAAFWVKCEVKKAVPKSKATYSAANKKGVTSDISTML